MDYKSIPPPQFEATYGYDINGFGGRNAGPQNRGGYGLVNLNSGDIGFIKSKFEDNGPVISKYCATKNLEIRGGGVLMEKVGFKYAGTSSINTGKSKGSRFDILKDLTDFDSEEGNFQKGKGVDFKVKGVLSKVTNLKVTTSGSKKPRKAKGSFKLGDSGCSQKKTDGSSSKGKKQLMRNTNSGNEKSLFYSGWPADSSIEVRADNSQVVREEIGVLQQLHQDIANAMKNDQIPDSGGMDSSKDLAQPSDARIRDKQINLGMASSFNSEFMFILQMAMVEFLNKFANTERLNWVQWAVCIGIAALSWPIGFLLKCLPVSGKQHFLKHGASAS
ncbi:hypothetical protein JRO89_XS09G0167400 [Xanthoceras sorbifolium]|uniref:Uncharacterized protein n=1 Tax=Xanthoceras sorbifolium TaxID=99658 RepID=A0ABQ8HLI8_9ROSI|nr:hypothetical protein JRO89_XS09G0167400 [Xanthoceras sorbifolium]